MINFCFRKICNAANENVLNQTCPATRKYCSLGNCVANRPSSCQAGAESQPNKNLCPGVGVFPSPNSCTKYIMCQSKSDNGLEVTCPNSPSYAFDPATGNCKLRRAVADCPVINCAANQNKFISYTLDPKLYFFCGKDGIILLQCEVNNTFNSATENCEFQCKKSGRFPDESSSTNYFECLDLGNNRFSKVEQTCPSGTVFSAEMHICIDDPNNPTPNQAEEQ